KAVYQPMFKLRRWLEVRKKTIPTTAPEGTLSISQLETKLSPLRGENANFNNHAVDLEEAKERLDEFYNNKRVVARHKWDAKKARDVEYKIIADRLLKMIGGSVGRKRGKRNKAVIGVGLGQFDASCRLSSLHESFSSYFVSRARSLGYVVVGVNEYYTSKKCPTCETFVCQVEIRRLYCANCKTYFHRDVLAGHNIANIVRGHLLHQERPLYLQPVDGNGLYPWMKPELSVAIGSASTSISDDINSTTSTTNVVSSTSNRSCKVRIGKKQTAPSSEPEGSKEDKKRIKRIKTEPKPLSK
ncbi:hypothetical protein BGZ76_001241, partial [Entomortierella beljakovae]